MSITHPRPNNNREINSDSKLVFLDSSGGVSILDHRYKEIITFTERF